jgi:hypothetical protein
LVDALHVGGRWPKSRPGEIDQAIASAKFVEATAGMMNTAIKTYHLLLKRMMEQALRLCFMVDKKNYAGEKSVSGILKNQEFIEEYNTKDIDLDNRIRVEYGLGLGRDPAQSAVLMLQYANGPRPFISKEFVQENIDGLNDVGRERARIDVEAMRDMIMAKLQEALQSDQLPPEAIPKIMQARLNGEDLIELYEKYVVQPQQDAAQQQLGTGLPGAAPTPGAPGSAPPDGGLPGGPAGPAGLTPPPAPDPSQLTARLGVPAGNRQSFLGVQSVG